MCILLKNTKNHKYMYMYVCLYFIFCKYVDVNYYIEEINVLSQKQYIVGLPFLLHFGSLHTLGRHVVGINAQHC